MPYFAHFQMHEGHQFRLDTRIYLRDDAPRDGDQCVAAIIGKNPGSANGRHFGKLSPISLDGDKLLPYVRLRFQNGYKQAGVTIPSGAYVRVWNLFYLCNKTLSAAVKAHTEIRRPLICDTEAELPPIVWFAWGPPATWHSRLSDRFYRLGIEHPFYVDIDTKAVVAKIPDANSRVKHTQGLLASSVERHLASLLGN